MKRVNFMFVLTLCVPSCYAGRLLYHNLLSKYEKSYQHCCNQVVQERSTSPSLEKKIVRRIQSMEKNQLYYYGYAQEELLKMYHLLFSGLLERLRAQRPLQPCIINEDNDWWWYDRDLESQDLERE